MAINSLKMLSISELEDVMNDIYLKTDESKIPWNIPEIPEQLIALLKNYQIKDRKTLEIGCGLGHYSLWLAGKGFDVTGIDVSSIAVQNAVKKAKDHKLKCRFITGGFPETKELSGEKFDFIFDWEVLHHIGFGDRGNYFRKVADLLNEHGFYYSVSFNEKDPFPGGTGKIRRTHMGTTLYFASLNELEDQLNAHFDFVFIRTEIIAGRQNPHVANTFLARKKS
ncbi:MAG: SAM-dependent methyltransferase [Melioribacteraceae bacterium]|nr:MAG: SAM-dependent methyltransferase [Melioribacteraceae bacterium]